MNKMKPETPLDYAVLQLSPRHTRCELFVSSDGNTEKLASGLVNQFVIHLKAAEDQVQQAVQSIRLEVERHKNADKWFTKGAVERFVQFTGTPDVLEMVNTFYAEMSQLEAARKIYSQGTGNQHTAAEVLSDSSESDFQSEEIVDILCSPVAAFKLCGDDTATIAAADATKKELLRAIDVRLATVRQDLIAACARASATGFNPDTVSELRLFADEFGTQRLNEACTKFMSLYQRRPDLISPWKPRVNDIDVRSSYGSDMSIDDPSEDTSWSHNKSTSSYSLTPQNFDASKPSTWQQPKSSSSSSFLQRSDLKEKKEEATQDFTEEKKEKGDEAVTESSSTVTPANQTGRRLSVQDRINLFENKRKESSGGGSSSGKPIVGKSVELKRLSSDLSSGPSVAEKAVLRRWSGASDMSIDVSVDKKDIESPLCTPSSVSSVSQTKIEDVSEDRDDKGLSNSGITSSAEPRTGSDWAGEVGFKEQVEDQAQIGKEDEGSKTKNYRKDPVISHDQARSGTSRTNIGSNSDRAIEESKLSGGGEDKNAGVNSNTHLKGSTSQLDTRVKTQVAHQSQIGAKAGNATFDRELVNKVEDAGIRSQSIAASRFRVSHNHSRSFSGQLDGGVGSNFKEVSSFQLKEVEGDQFASQPHGRSFSGEIEESGKKDYELSSRQKIKIVDFEVQKMKYQKPVYDSEQQFKKSQSKRDESQVSYDESKLDVYSDEVMETQDSGGVSYSTPMDQVQRMRKSRSTQGVNDELKMKADELEKLFAEHKLRVPGDQSASARRSEITDKQIEHAVSLQYRRPAEVELVSSEVPDGNSVIEPIRSSSNVANFNCSSLVKTIENNNTSDAPRQGFSPLNFADGARGKLYHKYIQKRDAKLREEWSTNRSEKEARLKAMHDSLERSRAEMKARFSGTDGNGSVSTARRRAEKLRSFNVRSNINRGQHPIESLQNEDEDLSEFMNSGSKSTKSKKTLAGRNLSSSTPRVSSVPLPRSSIKAPNLAGRRTVPSENPLSQSVPNFSDLRKENTKPSSGVSKPTNRSQVRNYDRRKSDNEEVQGVKEEKSKRSQFLRKSSVNPTEYKDVSSLNSDDLVLVPLKFDMEQIVQGPHGKVLNVDSRTLARQASGTGPGAGASVVRKKSSAASDNYKNDEEDDELASEAEDSFDVAKEEEDDVETVAFEECRHSDLGKGRLLQDSDKSEVSGSEIGDSTRSFSQVDSTLVAGMPATLPSSFNNAGYLQDSPVESPMSWHSRLQHPYTYPQEISDVDAYAESPIDSPASWNSHALTQTEDDAARMRKKWGSAQKPVLVANSSQQSRRDMARGFKRLLKFGRKSRGSETLVDWVSATTSEGDDDTEDGRDPANKSSEDLRKSRMGFSRGQPSDDGFNESELFSEQVQSIQSSIPAPPANFKLRDDQYTGSSLKAPRSFFSLATFRKGGDSKPR